MRLQIDLEDNPYVVPVSVHTKLRYELFALRLCDRGTSRSRSTRKR